MEKNLNISEMDSGNQSPKKKNYSKPVTKKHDPLNIVRSSGGVTLYYTSLYSLYTLYTLYTLYHECSLYYYH